MAIQICTYSRQRHGALSAGAILFDAVQEALRGLHGRRRLAADVKWCATRRCGIGKLRPTPLSVSGAETDAH